LTSIRRLGETTREMALPKPALMFLAAMMCATASAQQSAEFVYKPASERPLKVRLEYPDGWKASDQRAALIYFYHGFSPRAHAETQFEEQVSYFRRRGLVVVRADYREKNQGAETPRTCIEDIYSAVRWVRQNAGKLGIDPRRVAIGSGSGSAHLPASVFYTQEIRAAADDPKISPIPGAMFIYHPDLDNLDPEIWYTMLQGRPRLAGQMPPAIVFIGTKDPGYPAITKFFGTLKEHGAPVELFVAEGAIHGFYKFSPWLEKTTLRADALLQSLGYLQPDPRVTPPALAQPAAYGGRTEENQQRWMERHKQKEAERAQWIAANRPSSYVYKTTPDGLRLNLAVHYPENWKPGDHRTAIVMFEGGGFNPGEGDESPRQRGKAEDQQVQAGNGFSAQADYFARRGCVTFRVGYRKRKRDGATPEKSIEDAISAVRWVRQNAARLGIDPQRVVSAGGSSGGNLAASVAAIDRFQAASDDRSISQKPNAMLLYFPLLDWLQGGSMSDRFLAAVDGDKERAARLSPALGWRRDMPPTLVLIGTKDPVYDVVRKFVAKWKAEGCPIDIFIGEGGGHGFSNKSPWLEKTTARADEFLRSISFLGEEPKAPLPVASR
jgi:acetyl esterase